MPDAAATQGGGCADARRGPGLRPEMSMTPLYLNDADMRRALPPGEIYAVVEDTLKAAAAGRVVSGAKTGFTLDDAAGPRFLGATPSGLTDAGVAGIKWFATCAGNGRLGLPRVPATMIVCDSTTGMLRGVVDATALTAWRTAALAIAAVVRCTKRPVEKAAVIGLGAIGKALVHYLAQGVAQRIAVFGRDGAKTRRDAALLARELSAAVEPVDSAEAAVRGAALVITATGLDRDDPLVFGDWIAPGATVCGLGSYQELDETVVAHAARIFVDHHEDCLRRGNLAPLFRAGRLAPERVTGEVADLVAGKLSGRASATEIVVIALIGLAPLDMALAARALERAAAGGYGQRLTT
jgi:ornithine cyclodeaminase/alanine dehydrogenase-like protein (mu-crystallin family)